METPETKKNRLKKYAASLPHQPGVYIYKDNDGKVLYVGKAVDLKRRVSQYFARDDAIGDKTILLVPQIHRIETVRTLTEFDALLVEAKLIWHYQPKYNSIAKDDKSPLYIRISLTTELPLIEFVRKPREYISGKDKNIHIFGPFQSSRMARSIMRSIREIIPYCTQKQRNGKPCFYTQIGLCNPCPSSIYGTDGIKEKRMLTLRYRNNIRKIIKILSGQARSLLTMLTGQMQFQAEKQNFEKAAFLRDTVSSIRMLLQKNYDPMVFSGKNSVPEMADRETELLKNILSGYFHNLQSLKRIECMDISNIGKSYVVGSLAVLHEGLPDTASYRRFRINLKKVPDDVSSIGEVVKRRFTHPEWIFPDLLVIDGGKSQVNRAVKILSDSGISLPVIGLAKRFESIIIPLNSGYKTISLPLNSPALHLLQRVRDEAHRFALKYHRLLRTANQI